MLQMPGYLKRLADVLGGRDRCRIFISYRRQGEGAGYAGRLADKLLQEFGDDQCFRDIDDIESGVDFVRSISEAVGGCEVLISVIGRDWISITDAEGRSRLEDPNDFVRLEIAAGLSRDVRVIPVLVGGAVMPSAEDLPDALAALSRRQAHEITDTRWDFDVGRLIDSIEAAGIKRLTQKRSFSARQVGFLSAAAALVVLFITVGLQVADVTPQRSAANLDTPPESTLPAELGDRPDPLVDVKGDAGPALARDAPGGTSAPSDEAARALATARAEEVARAADAARAAEAARESRDAEARAAIETVLFSAQPAQSEAFRRLDPTSLSYFFEGEALSENLTLLNDLQMSGTHMDLQLEGYDVLSVEVEGDFAVAEVREAWSAQIHQNGTDFCLGTIASHSSFGQRFLSRASGSWKISGMSEDDLTPDLTVGC